MNMTTVGNRKTNFIESTATGEYVNIEHVFTFRIDEPDVVGGEATDYEVVAVSTAEPQCATMFRGSEQECMDYHMWLRGVLMESGPVRKSTVTFPQIDEADRTFARCILHEIARADRDGYTPIEETRLRLDVGGKNPDAQFERVMSYLTWKGLVVRTAGQKYGTHFYRMAV